MHSIQLLHTSLLSNCWELDHGEFSSCLCPHTTHTTLLPGVRVLCNLTIVQSSWKTIFFGKSLQSYIKIGDFNNGKNTVQERSMILLGFFFSYYSFSLPPSCCLYLLGALQSKLKCYTGWFSFKRNYRKRKKKRVEQGMCLTCINAFSYYPCSCCLCSFDQTLAEDLFKFWGHLEVLDTTMDGDHQLWQFHLPLFQH